MWIRTKSLLVSRANVSIYVNLPDLSFQAHPNCKDNSGLEKVNLLKFF